VELKSTADLANKLQRATRERDDLREMLEQTIGSSVAAQSTKAGSRRASNEETVEAF
jgi:hypothetical protein